MDVLEDKHFHRLSVGLCLLGSLFVVMKMITGSNMFLVLFIAAVSGGILFDKVEHKIHYILYFVPWAYAIKFNFDQMSLLTLLSGVYIIVCVGYILLNNISFSVFYSTTLLSLILYSFFSILISESATLTSVMSFLLNFLVIALAVLFIRDKHVIPTYIVIHALGLIVSGVVNLLGNLIPAIEHYITSYTIYHIVYTPGILYTRFTGLDLDPNYFSIQALLAIACLCTLLLSSYVKLSSAQKVTAIVFILALSSMGILTLSKMFLLSFTVLLLIVLVLVFKENFKKGFYVLFFLTGTLSLVLVLFYDYLYQAFFQRFFSEGMNAGSITTGRSDIWKAYYMEITGDGKLLFLGNGISRDFYNHSVPHNMYLIAWYYLGLIGMLIFLYLFITLYIQLKENLHHTAPVSIFSIYIIPLFITVFANVSLDSFVMNYFGIHIFLILIVLMLNEKKAQSPVPSLQNSS